MTERDIQRTDLPAVKVASWIFQARNLERKLATGVFSDSAKESRQSRIDRFYEMAENHPLGQRVAETLGVVLPNRRVFRTHH